MISRRRFGALAAAGLGFGFSCKNNPVGPTPDVLPPLGQARGIPNATALQNLDLITRLAQRERPGAYVYEIDGPVDLSGRILPANEWQYLFRHEGATPGTDIWQVVTDGTLEWELDRVTGRNAWLVDIAPLVKFDSDRMIRIARTTGELESCTTKPGAHGRTIST